MKLLTQANIKTLPTLDATANLSIAEQSAYVKLFNPCGRHTWYITAYSPDEKLAFGFVTTGDAQCAELGYISITELESIRLMGGLGIERDIHFKKQPLDHVIKTIKQGGHI